MGSSRGGQWAERHEARHVSVQHDTARAHFGRARGMARHACGLCRA